MDVTCTVVESGEEAEAIALNTEEGEGVLLFITFSSLQCYYSQNKFVKITVFYKYVFLSAIKCWNIRNP